jgi:mannose-1-phosphate guanylyltransferase
MRAILLAAGLGTRLRPITDTIPKCLVPINNKPLLQIWLERLTESDIGPFLINTHYLPEQVEKFIEESGYSSQVKLVRELELLGTARTLITNLDFFKDEDGLLVHADNYCLADFNDFIEAHKRRPLKCLMTMMTFRTDKPSLCGIVELNRDGIVIEFHEKVNNPPNNLANGAVYIVSKDMVNMLKNNFKGFSDFSTEVLPLILGRIFSHETKNQFIDIGTLENYNKANQYASNENIF